MSGTVTTKIGADFRIDIVDSVAIANDVERRLNLDVYVDNYSVNYRYMYMYMHALTYVWLGGGVRLAGRRCSNIIYFSQYRAYSTFLMYTLCFSLLLVHCHTLTHTHTHARAPLLFFRLFSRFMCGSTPCTGDAFKLSFLRTFDAELWLDSTNISDADANSIIPLNGPGTGTGTGTGTDNSNGNSAKKIIQAKIEACRCNNFCVNNTLAEGCLCNGTMYKPLNYTVRVCAGTF